MGYDPSSPFITSAFELKLDQNTMFEGQRHSQRSTDVPHYQELLDVLNHRGQALESSITEGIPKKPKHDTPTSQCILHKPDEHLLYACPNSKIRHMNARLPP